VSNLEQPIVIIPMDRWNRMTEKALRFALVLSSDIRVVHIDSEDSHIELTKSWNEMVEKPLAGKDLPKPKLVVLKSQYRQIVNPLVQYVLNLEKHNSTRKITVLLPELVVRHWWENILHNQRTQLLKFILLVRGNQRIIVVNIPWYI